MVNISASFSDPDPHSMGSWIRIQKEGKSAQKRRRIKYETQKKCEN
jgi:hypothetical protein